jgi:hypothetical protein
MCCVVYKCLDQAPQPPDDSVCFFICCLWFVFVVCGVCVCVFLYAICYIRLYAATPRTGFFLLASCKTPSFYCLLYPLRTSTSTCSSAPAPSQPPAPSPRAAHLPSAVFQFLVCSGLFRLAGAGSGGLRFAETERRKPSPGPGLVSRRLVTQSLGKVFR